MSKIHLCLCQWVQKADSNPVIRRCLDQNFSYKIDPARVPLPEFQPYIETATNVSVIKKEHRYCLCNEKEHLSLRIAVLSNIVLKIYEEGLNLKQCRPKALLALENMRSLSAELHRICDEEERTDLIEDLKRLENEIVSKKGNLSPSFHQPFHGGC